MSLLRTAARGMLASIFIYGGLDAVRNPGPKTAAADPVVDELSDRIEQIPNDTEMLVRANGALQVGAGLALATNTLARPAALALAASLVPTTAAGHRFWEADTDATRAQQTIHFLKNLGLFGGLVIAALDTEGEPGVAWRTQHAVEHASTLAEHKTELAGLHADLAKERAKSSTAETRARVTATGKQARRDLKLAAKASKGAGRGLARAGKTAKKVAAGVLPI